MIVSKFNKKMKILKLHLHPLKIFDYSQKAGSGKTTNTNDSYLRT
jgi:hypothetical protein